MTLMKKTLALCLALMALGSILGCGQNPPPKSGTTHLHLVKRYSQSELARLIVPGMTPASLTNLFGPPTFILKSGENGFDFEYLFPHNPRQTNGLVGFGIDIRNGLVVRWEPTTTGGPAEQQVDNAPQRSFGTQPFEGYLVTDSLTNVANAVLAQGSTTVANLPASPDVTFQAEVFATDPADRPIGGQTMGLVVTGTDISKLATLTEKNIGRQLLLVTRTKAVYAVYIQSVLNTPSLTLPVKDSAALDNILSCLSGH